MNPATNATITAPTIRYVLLEPPDPLLRLLPLLFAKIFLFLVRGEIVAHAARLSERPQSASATSHTATTTISGASSRRPARIWGGIILIASATPSGIMRRSWRYPRTGIGSGIRSMGLKACATTTAARARALSGPCKPDTARRLRRTHRPWLGSTEDIFIGSSRLRSFAGDDPRGAATLAAPRLAALLEGDARDE